MIEQRAVLKSLNENPVTETAPWIFGEPSMQDLLGDPVVHAVLRRDGLSVHDLKRAIARGRGRLSPTLAVSNLSVAPGVPATKTLAVDAPAGAPPASDAA
jgi:hypothetical protein